jgi:hypothetical protein
MTLGLFEKAVLADGFLAPVVEKVYTARPSPALSIPGSQRWPSADRSSISGSEEMVHDISRQALPSGLRPTAADRPDIAQPVAERDIPHQPWRAMALIVAVLTNTCSKAFLFDAFRRTGSACAVIKAFRQKKTSVSAAAEHGTEPRRTGVGRTGA